ncbi:MAG: NUDIX domain-containing protein [Patescibacteria group bacterium]
MDHQILQFGTPAGEYPEKPSAYAVVLYDNKLLCLLVRNKYHLPGGGLEGTEDPQLAVKREVLEETGYTVTDLKEVGEANQFFEMTREGHPLNKLATFFKGSVDLENVGQGKEGDHEVKWISVDEFLSSTAGDFQKWAVRKVVESE